MSTIVDTEIDPAVLRSVLGAFPTGVTALAALVAGVPVGMAANSFTSVSLDPPLVLWCMERHSRRHDIFAKAESFTVSILGTEHKDVSSRLARPGEHALDGIALIQTELGPPALADSLAVFECKTERKIEGGDHTILLGRVMRFSCPSDSAPLVYFRGKYSALQQNG